jgi:hypothetical protein
MARAAAAIRPYKSFVYAQAGAAEFCADMQELGMPFTVIDSARELYYTDLLINRLACYSSFHHMVDKIGEVAP